MPFCISFSLSFLYFFVLVRFAGWFLHVVLRLRCTQAVASTEHYMVYKLCNLYQDVYFSALHVRVSLGKIYPQLNWLCTAAAVISAVVSTVEL